MKAAYTPPLSTTGYSLLRRIGATMLLAVLLAACSAETPLEDSVKSFIADAESGFEDRKLQTIRSMVSASYTDERNRNREDILRYAGYQILSNRSIHLFIVIDEITIPDQTTAMVRLFAAMSSSPVEDRSGLVDIQADIYRFDLELERTDDSWLLQRASWQPALLTDLASQ